MFVVIRGLTIALAPHPATHEDVLYHAAFATAALLRVLRLASPICAIVKI